MKKLTLMRGISGSGKSTLAKGMVLSQPNTVRLNRDLLRTMLHDDIWNGKKESITIEAEYALAETMLKNKQNVIIDDTNLSERTVDMWRRLANDEDVNAQFEIIDVETDIATCIGRDLQRENSVGSNVIIQQALQYKEFMKDQKVIIVDLDGTLCDTSNRTVFVKGPGKKDWKSFFAGIKDDPLREDVAAMIMADLKPDTHVILVSGRPENYREVTMNWLAEMGQKYQHEFPSFVTLLMRRQDDNRDDDIVKREIYEKYLKHTNVVKVFDDRPRVIRMWRELGLEVEDVGTGEEF